jgi:hypothetical protein
VVPPQAAQTTRLFAIAHERGMTGTDENLLAPRPAGMTGVGSKF